MKKINRIEIEKSDFGFQFDYYIDNKEYSVQIIYPGKEDNYAIPYILVIPKLIKDNSVLAVEVNDLETEDKGELLNDGLLTAYNLTSRLKEYDNPILIPIIPSVKNGISYYQ